MGADDPTIEKIYSRQDRHRDEILTAIGSVKTDVIRELDEVKGNQSEIRKGMEGNSRDIAYIKGKLPGIKTDIKRIDKEVGVVRGWFIKVLMTAVGSGGAAGTLAAFLLELAKK